MSIVDHFMEFKKRFILSLAFFIFTFAICWTYREVFLKFFTYPLLKNSTINHLIFTKITEAFTSYIHIIFLSALVFSLPFILTQIWMFLSPALSHNEKSATRGYTIASLFLFFSGAIFAYFFIIPVMFDFFLGFQNFVKTDTALSLYIEPKISEYISTIQSMLMAFGLAFQLPIGLVLSVQTGILSLNDLKYNRKYAILSATIIGAVLTPPDVISQIMLALPLLVLYEASILYLSLKKSIYNRRKIKHKKQ
jgi:sec-independent protein translocase protein TatC